jgi:UDP-N-acetylmuramoyl-L-alanyl-D-glutamate--2,6-diaminopimelate ligase
MKLSALLSDYVSIPESQDCEITSLCLSSRDAQAGALFFAYPGEKADGRNYIQDAINKGAVAIVLEEKNGPLHVSLKNLQHKIGPIAQKFYDYPAKNMQIIGVTGTSGKTSVTNIIAQMLNVLGKNAYVMGTFGIGKPEGPFVETGINTPDPISIQRYFTQLKQQGCDVIVMEVSSHALAQGRVQGLVFDAAIFTNLTQDHLDYHQTMQEYALAKEQFLIDHEVKHAIFNVDDPWCRDLYERYKKTAIECRDFSVSNRIVTLEKTALIGEFNLQNLLAAVTCLILLGYDEEKVIAALPLVRPIPGRLECVRVAGMPCCVIDYAHKPDALEKALIAVRHIAQGKLFCVFGCGGDRDKGKRPMMAKIAERYADAVCITDDNPRTENSANILQEILSGFDDKTQVRVVPDRAEAIKSTIALAKENDVVLIAGKGHEDYQIIGHEKRYFSDREIVSKIVK